MMLTPEEKYRSRLIEARRQQILDAAARVFARRGFHRAAVSEIAAEAGVADGTIYNYFENKEALLQGLLLRLQEAAGRATASRGADTGSGPASLLRRRMAFFAANRELLQALLPEVLAQPALRETFMRAIIAPGLEVSEIFLQTTATQGAAGGRVDDVLLARSFEALALGSLLLQLLGDPLLAERWPELPELMGRLAAGA